MRSTRFHLLVLMQPLFALTAHALTPSTDATAQVKTDSGCLFYTYPSYQITKAQWSGTCTPGQGISGTGTLEFEARRVDKDSGALLGLRIGKLSGNFKDGWMEGQGQFELTRKSPAGVLASVNLSKGEFWHSDLNGPGKSIDSNYNAAGTVSSTKTLDGVFVKSVLNGRGRITDSLFSETAHYKTRVVEATFNTDNNTNVSIRYSGTLLGGDISFEVPKLPDGTFEPPSGSQGTLKLPHSTWAVKLIQREEDQNFFEGAFALQKGNTSLVFVGLRKAGTDYLKVSAALKQDYPDQGYTRTDQGVFLLTLSELDLGTITIPSGEDIVTSIEKAPRADNPGFNLTCAPLNGDNCTVKTAWFPGYAGAPSRINSIFAGKTSDQYTFPKVSKTGPAPYDWKPTLAVVQFAGTKASVRCSNPTSDSCDKTSSYRSASQNLWEGRMRLIENTWSPVGSGRMTYNNGTWANLYFSEAGALEQVYDCGDAAKGNYYTCRISGSKTVVFTPE